MKRFAEWKQKNSPPGYEYEKESHGFWLWLLIFTFFSLGFFVRYHNALNNLYCRIEGERVLIEGVKMVPFYELVESILIGALVSGVAFVAILIVSRFVYYRSDSKSIYTMRRIKDRTVLWTSYVKVPITYFVIQMLICAVLVLLYFWYYMLLTPTVCL